MAYPLHPASLVDPSEHSHALLDMLELPINRNLVEYVVLCTVDAVDFAMRRPSTSTPSGTYKYAPFTEFVSNVLYRSEVKIPVVLTALTYIARAKRSLSIALEQWACERVFLGALILASKYSNDSSLKNAHWALCSGVFGRRDVGRIEREFLDVLNFDLSISESELLAHHIPITSLYIPVSTYRRPSLPQIIPTHKRRRSEVSEEISSWSDDDDSLSSTTTSSSAWSPPTPPSSFDDERSHKRLRSSFDAPQRPNRSADSSLPGALELLRSFPIPILGTAPDSGCKPRPQLFQPPRSAQLWV